MLKQSIDSNHLFEIENSRKMVISSPTYLERRNFGRKYFGIYCESAGKFFLHIKRRKQ